jgi:GDP-4-dehydro-6-deoxy-D-mannose reductase
MKVLITGAGGFIGGFLVRHSLSAGCSVLGLDIQQPEDLAAGASFTKCDVRNAVELSEQINSFQPDRIFHLAAQSFPTVSMAKPRETMDINAGGTINLFESLRESGLRPVVVVACSSAEYGLVAPEDLPVLEEHPLRPLHPYGVSKVAQDLLAAQYFANYSIPTVRIRIFNTTGPGKLGDVCSDLTRRAVEIELGLRPPSLKTGNTTTRRAIADVRDLVRGLWCASESGVHGDVYNVGGNQVYAVHELIQAIRGLVKVRFTIEQDPALVRRCDEPVIAGNTTKFRQCSGWAPELDLFQTLQDMLDWWRNRLALAGVAPSAEPAGLPQEL